MGQLPHPPGRWPYQCAAEAGTPDGLCSDSTTLHGVPLEHLVLLCPDPQPWGTCTVWVYWYTEDTWEDVSLVCDQGTIAIYDLDSQTQTFGAGTCQFWTSTSPGEPTPPSTWPWFIGWGNGHKLCFTITDDPLDAVYHLVDFLLTC